MDPSEEPSAIVTSRGAFSDNLRTPVTASYTSMVLPSHTAAMFLPATVTCVNPLESALMVLRILPQAVVSLEDIACSVVQSSSQDERLLRNNRRRVEVSGDRGKAV